MPGNFKSKISKTYRIFPDRLAGMSLSTSWAKGFKIVGHGQPVASGDLPADVLLAAAWLDAAVNIRNAPSAKLKARARLVGWPMPSTCLPPGTHVWIEKASSGKTFNAAQSIKGRDLQSRCCTVGRVRVASNCLVLHCRDAVTFGCNAC